MKKTKYIAIIVAAMTVAVLALAACGGGQAQNAQSSDDTSAAPAAAPAEAENAFIVGFDADYPPYGFRAEDGSYTGFDLDLAAAVCEMNGWDFEAKPIDWDAKDLELDSGNITCIWNGFTYEGREDQYAWSEPYMLNAQVFVVAQDSDITSYENMGGKKVVTQAGSAAYGILTDGEEHEPMEDMFDGGKVQTVPEYNTAFMQLESGAVDVVACDLSFAKYYMNQSPDKFKMLDDALNSEHYAVGFKLGNEEMAQIVTESLKALYEDGTVAELIEKYEMNLDDWVLI